MQAALPQLLFQTCHKYCVDTDQFTAEGPAEQQCIKNCQDKTYASFDIFEGMRKRKEPTGIVIDKAAYIGMETEHAFDTTGDYKRAGQKTMDLQGVGYFVKF